MHIYMILDPDTCVYDAHMHDALSMILNHACMYGACIYDAANFVTDGRTRRF